MNSNYPVFILSSEQQLEQCPLFTVDEFRWTCVYKPETTGRLAYIPGKGFFLKMYCKESNPMRKNYGINSPVYRDSAMEGFFQFFDHPSNSLYFNFEMNANGSLLAQHGDGRFHRTFLSEQEIISCNCQAQRSETDWTVSVWIPESLLQTYYPSLILREGVSFRCNFFKISETPEIEHYASAYPIDSPEPNFHLPQFFGTAVLTKPTRSPNREHKPYFYYRHFL